MEELRDAENDWYNGRRKREEQSDVRNVQSEQKRTDGIDFDQVEIDASHYLNVYDVDVIYSWNPRQFKNFIKGARLAEIDHMEQTAISAMFNANAANGKRVTVKKLFDADKARKQIDSVEGKKEPGKHLGRYHAAQAAMKAYRPQLSKEGE